MTTNILAQLVITLVTNVVQTDNARYEPDFSVLLTSMPAQYGQRLAVPATERYTTTNVIEQATLTWTWNGQPYTQTVDREISSVTYTEQLVKTWVPAPRSFIIAPDKAQSLFMTNLILDGYSFTSPPPKSSRQR